MKEEGRGESGPDEQSVVASANPAAPAAKRAERDSRPTAIRSAGASTCGTSPPQNGHALSLCFTWREQDGQGVNRGIMTLLIYFGVTLITVPVFALGPKFTQ
jgi:hypothetical protein